MNSHKNLIPSIIIFLLIISVFSCIKEKIMSVSNDSISDISYTTATAHATIIDPGEGIEQHGHCWSTNVEPTISTKENITENGPINNSGSYSSTLTGLAPGTKYYVRAYVKNGSTVVYGGDILPFTTLSLGTPVVNTGTVSEITASSATVGANLNSLGEGVSSVTQHGHCWSSETTTPTIENDNKSSLGSRETTGSYESELVGLSSNTIYYVRAYATNSEGTAYGNQVDFTTIVDLPTVVTMGISLVTSTSAQSGGDVTSDGGTSVTARGVCWNTSENPTISDYCITEGSGTGSFTCNIIGLSPGITYYVRAFATNSAGTAYGNQVVFTTISDLPTVETTGISLVTTTSAQSGGSVTSDGGTSVTARGVCWSIAQNPTISDNYTTDGSGMGSFTSNISELDPGTKYYVRAYATNAQGTKYGMQYSFVTLWDNSPVSDYEGNAYATVQIGEQIWMAENLRSTKYNDGTEIPLVTDNTEWSNLSTPAYCWYNNNEATYKDPYGALYNWYTVNTGKLCPTGWHVSTDGEWTIMTEYLDENYAGGKLKETGTTHWNSPNTGATNETGFNALPGGDRATDGKFEFIGYYGNWWSATQINTNNAWYRNMHYNTSYVYRPDNNLKYGFSVRCIRD
jgi:uncharacterized protein (TIGR02145 family)